jgi:predicted kinase
VIVDATFREQARRQTFFDAARNWGVPVRMLICRADAQTIRDRLARRTGDASDANWSVYESLSKEWEEPGHAIRESVQFIETAGGLDEATNQALATLRQWRLFT